MSILDNNRNKQLTIAILSYNNIECVKHIIESIGVIPANVEIVVFDDSFPSTKIKKWCDEKEIKCIQYNYHISMAANIIKPFEYVESEFLWTVGNCNSFEHDGLKTVLELLNNNPSHNVLLHQENNLWIKQPFPSESLIINNWQDCINTFSHSIFSSINSFIYRTRLMKPLIAHGYNSITCMVPHTAMLYRGLTTGALDVTFFPKKVFNRHIRTRVWSMEQHIRCLPDIFPLEDQKRDRVEFLELIKTTDPWIFTSQEYLTLKAEGTIIF